MPRIDVVFYKEGEKTPLLEWLDKLPKKPKVKCIERIGRLEKLGHEIRRPEADFLRDKIYELRVRWQRVNYRMLYFFYKNQVVVISHGITKEDKVPPKEIDLAINRMKKFVNNPKKHSYTPGEQQYEYKEKLSDLLKFNYSFGIFPKM